MKNEEEEDVANLQMQFRIDKLHLIDYKAYSDENIHSIYKIDNQSLFEGQYGKYQF